MAELNAASIKKLEGVEPRLARLIKDCIEKYPFKVTVTEGLRTKEQQAENVRKGVSQTMNSKHIPRDGESFSRAVDVAMFKSNGKYSSDLRDYKNFAMVVLKEAKSRGLKVTWGGSWKTLVDGPHFQIEN